MPNANLIFWVPVVGELQRERHEFRHVRTHEGKRKLKMKVFIKKFEMQVICFINEWAVVVF